MLGVTRGRLLTLVDVPDDVAVRFGTLVDQRADRVPLQHLTGRAPFRLPRARGRARASSCPGRRPSSSPAGRWSGSPGPTAPIVVDLGSGSGAIALSIAHEHPGARVTAVERDPGAIEWTRHNARRGRRPVTRRWASSRAT